jgi:hypothetical protein
MHYIYYVTEADYQLVKLDNTLPTMHIASCQQNRSNLTNGPLYTIHLVSESWERHIKSWSRIIVFRANRFTTLIISQSNNKMYMIRTFVLLAGRY